MILIKRTKSIAAGRNARIFGNAMRRLTQEIDAIFARHSVAGHLKSGGTIKALVRAMDDTTTAAVNDGLNGIAAVTEHAGAKRRRLIDEFSERLTQHQKSATEVIRIAIERIGLGNDFEYALPLIAQVERGQRERISDFAEGWTAPIGKPWHERHPIILAFVAAIIGSIATWLADYLM